MLAYFADLLAKAIDIANLYVTGLKLSKDLDPQECMHGEEFIPIVVYILIQVLIIVSFNYYKYHKVYGGYNFFSLFYS